MHRLNQPRHVRLAPQGLTPLNGAKLNAGESGEERFALLNQHAQSADEHPVQTTPDVPGAIAPLSSVAPPSDWLLWQLADSAFPTGGFAHSAGLEAAIHHGEVRQEDNLCAYIQTSLCQCGHTSLLFMLAALDNPEHLPDLDRLCHDFTTNHVANRASRLQGRALLFSAERIFVSPGQKTFQRLSAEIPFCHLAPAFGAILKELDVARSTAARLFLFLHLRGLISAAVRLGLVGPLQGQALQKNLAIHAENVLAVCQLLSVSDIAQTAPLLDLWQANQDCLYSRLFQS